MISPPLPRFAGMVIAFPGRLFVENFDGIIVGCAVTLNDDQTWQIVQIPELFYSSIVDYYCTRICQNSMLHMLE